MRIYLQWLNPAPFPTCGFKVLYRRKGDSAYSSVDTSGTTTSGSTMLTVPIDAPSCYEGLIQSNCCDNILSPGDPYGVNVYVGMAVSVAVRLDPLAFRVTLTSAYGNPYDTLA